MFPPALPRPPIKSEGKLQRASGDPANLPLEGRSKSRSDFGRGGYAVSGDTPSPKPLRGFDPPSRGGLGVWDMRQRSSFSVPAIASDPSHRLLPLLSSRSGLRPSSVSCLRPPRLLATRGWRALVERQSGIPLWGAHRSARRGFCVLTPTRGSWKGWWALRPADQSSSAALLRGYSRQPQPPEGCRREAIPREAQDDPT
jgi:hypothetical protein